MTHLQPKACRVLTSNQLEGTAEYIQGADKQVEEAQEKNEFPNPLENAENLPFGVSLWGGGGYGGEKAQLESSQLEQKCLARELTSPPSTTTGFCTKAWKQGSLVSCQFSMGCISWHPPGCF